MSPGNMPRPFDPEHSEEWPAINAPPTMLDLLKAANQRVAELESEVIAEHERLLMTAERAERAEAKLEAVRGLQQYTMVDNQYVPISQFRGQWMQRPMIFADELEALLNKEQIK